MVEQVRRSLRSTNYLSVSIRIPFLHIYLGRDALNDQ